MKCYYCDQIIDPNDEKMCPGDLNDGANYNMPHVSQHELMERDGERDEMPWDTWEEYRGER